MPKITRSALIYIPGLPMTYGDLCPKRNLSLMRQVLVKAGHECSILDFGTLGTLEKLKAGAKNTSLAMTILESILEVRQLDFVVFEVETRASVSTLLSVSKVLRKMRPALRLVLTGLYAESYGVTLLNASRCFDAAFLENPEDCIVPFAECLHHERCAAQLPNVAFLGAPSPTYRPKNYRNICLPDYSEDHYPDAHAGQFQHFDVPMSRMPAQLCREACGINTTHLWVNTAESVHDEVKNIALTVKSRAVHFSGAFTPACESRDIFADYLGGDSHLRFSRDAHVHHVDSFSVNEWVRAGAHSVGFKVPSGSQRLLEDFYGECFGVSQVESVVRGCRDAGLFTTMHMQFPCPWDDLHTREESVRLLRRSRPDAVSFDMPEIVPASSWYQESKRFGFKMDYHQFGQWVCADGKTGAKELPYELKGWNTKKLVAEKRLLLDACAEMGIPVGMDAKTALAAALCGHENNVSEFQAKFGRASAHYDIETIGDMMALFNKNARLPLAHREQPIFSAYRIAVGN